MNPIDFRSVMITPKTTLRETYQIMNDTALMIALVIDADKKLLGTVTDGDIRRGLLKGLTLESAVEGVMNKNPITVLSGTPREEIRTIMTVQRIAQIPLVDEQKHVVGLELLTDIVSSPKKISTPVLIFAGGFGKRLQPLTENTPKPMLPVGGRPLLEHIVTRLASQGFHKFYLAVHYKEDVIRQNFGDGSRLGIQIEYIHETQPLGTVGAARLIADKIKEPVLLLNGDLLTAVNFLHLMKFHQTGKQPLTIGLKSYSYQVPYGVVRLNGDAIVDLQEKPSQTSFICAGIQVIDPALLALIPEGQPFDMPDLIRTAIAKGHRVVGFPIHEYWVDIGSRRDYERADSNFNEQFWRSE